MARERWPKARRSSGANQRALRSSAGVFLAALIACPPTDAVVVPHGVVLGVATFGETHDDRKTGIHTRCGRRARRLVARSGVSGAGTGPRGPARHLDEARGRKLAVPEGQERRRRQGLSR